VHWKRGVTGLYDTKHPLREVWDYSKSGLSAITPKLTKDCGEAEIIKVLHFLIKHHAMKTYWGSGGVTLRILNLGTRWRWVGGGKSSVYPKHRRRLAGPQNRSGSGGEVKKFLPLYKVTFQLLLCIIMSTVCEIINVRNNFCILTTSKTKFGSLRCVHDKLPTAWDIFSQITKGFGFQFTIADFVPCSIVRW